MSEPNLGFLSDWQEQQWHRAEQWIAANPHNDLTLMVVEQQDTINDLLDILDLACDQLHDNCIEPGTWAR